MSIQSFVLSKCAFISSCCLCGTSGAGGFGIKGFRGVGDSAYSDLEVDSGLDLDLGFD